MDSLDRLTHEQLVSIVGAALGATPAFDACSAEFFRTDDQIAI